jgi:hypothetical protein
MFLAAFGGSIAAIIPGALGLLAVLAWPHVRRIEVALTIQISGALAFSVYFAQGASLTAAFCSMVAASQLLVARAVRDRNVVLILFANSAILLAVVTGYTWNGLPSALALTGGLIGTFARMQMSTLGMKKTFLAATPFWLTHNVVTGSGFGLAVDAISVISPIPRESATSKFSTPIFA